MRSYTTQMDAARRGIITPEMEYVSIRETMNAVDPDYGVISCGRNNEYGHPHDAPVNRLNRADVELYRTDLMGSVVLVTNGEELAFFLETANTNLTGYEKAA